MRSRSPVFLVAALFASLAGCSEPEATPATEVDVHGHCSDEPFSATTLFLAEGHLLSNVSGPAGETPGNDAREAFVVEPLAWDSVPLGEGMETQGNVTLELWIRIDGAAPFPGQTGGSLQFFLQFGSSVALVSGGVREEGPPLAAPGTVVHINSTLPLPEGGFTIETNSSLRLVATSLFAGPGQGTTILHGGDTPSQVRFESRCSEPREWLLKRNLDFPVILPSNQGSFSHAIPAQEGVNRLTVDFDLEEGADRLIVKLRQMGGAGGKNDMDVVLLDSSGTVVYDAGSPFANETLILWPENMEAFAPPGKYHIRIDSYSGSNYTGKLSVIMEETEGHVH